MVDKYIKPFIKATIDCFSTMVNVVPVPKEVMLQLPPITQTDFCAIIGLSGDAQGLVSLAFEKDVALKVVSKFVGEEIDEPNSDVSDAIGELINIIAGAAKAEISGVKLMISLPSIMHGDRFFLSMPKDVTVIGVSFDLPEIGGACKLVIGLKENK